MSTLFSGKLALTFAAAICLCVGLAPSDTSAKTTKREACCHVPAGTVVEVELVDQVSTARQKRGDTFAIRLAAPLIVKGKIVLRTGTPGIGKVIESAGPGIGGKPAEMVLAASYLNSTRGTVSLDALQLAGRGHDNSTPSQILEIGGIASAPLGFVGIVMPGGGITFNSGTKAAAKISSDVTLPSLAIASQRDIALASTATGQNDAAIGSLIALPAPPPGKGQIVFFRAKSLLGTAQWFNVRENGKALGKLSNGAYFVQPEPPGIHSFTAKLEPELKDRLKLQVDAGETYFVEGTLTGGLVLSAADLSPSTIQKFNKAAKHLKLAPSPADDARSE